MDSQGSEWQRKGATLSDKTARKEFGLTQEAIVRAIRAGKLQFRYNAIYGNPFLRLLRREVEELIQKKHGEKFLKERRRMIELARIKKEMHRLETQIAALQARKVELLADLDKGRRRSS